MEEGKEELEVFRNARRRSRYHSLAAKKRELEKEALRDRRRPKEGRPPKKEDKWQEE